MHAISPCKREFKMLLSSGNLGKILFADLCESFAPFAFRFLSR